jgi:hypothetical protein
VQSAPRSIAPTASRQRREYRLSGKELREAT